MKRILYTISLCLGLLAGCAKKGPPELTLDQVPNALAEAFASARPSVKKNVEGIKKLLEQSQYASASIQLQALSGNTDLSDEQRNVLGGATIAVNRFLQEQVAVSQAQGSAEPAAKTDAPSPQPVISKDEAAAAAAVLEHHIRTK